MGNLHGKDGLSVILWGCYLGLWIKFMNGNYGDEYVWLKWFRMIYTIVTFAGYFGFWVIAIKFYHFPG